MYQDIGGTIRVRTASQTLEVIRPIIQRAGISRIANLTHLDNLGIPVYTCFRPASKNLTTSQGKGINHELAQCSAYMEAIELYFAEQVTPEKNLFSDKLDGKCLYPDALPKGLFSYQPDTVQVSQWNRGYNLIDQSECWIPNSFINFDLSYACHENGFFKKSTTGLASGNSWHEATCHAIYEIVERHCQAQFEQLEETEALTRLVDTDSIDYGHAAKIIELLKSKNVEVAVFDMTNELGLPTYQCIIADQHPLRGLGHYSGSGTHLNPGISLCRAITEAAQSRLTYIAGSRDDMFPQDYNHQWQPLNLGGGKPYKPLNTQCGSIEQQFESLLELLKQHQYRVICFDYTPKRFPIAVVKVTIPELMS